MGSKVTKINNNKRSLYNHVYTLIFGNFTLFTNIDLIFHKNIIEKILAHYVVGSHKKQYKFKLRNFVIFYYLYSTFVKFKTEYKHILSIGKTM